MMSGSDYPHSEVTFAGSPKILAGLPADEQAKPAPDRDQGIVAGNTARVYNFDVARLTAPCLRAKPLRIDEAGVATVLTEAARFRSWLTCLLSSVHPTRKGHTVASVRVNSAACNFTKSNMLVGVSPVSLR